MAPNHGGEPLGSIFGPMGSHWVQKMGQNVANYPVQRFDFTPKMEVTVIAPNHGGDPLGSICGPMGSHWVQKMGQNVENYHSPKFEFSTTAVIDFKKKMEVTVMAPSQGGDPLGPILGPMGSHWIQKMGQNLQKLPCPKIGIVDYPVVNDFSQKAEVTALAPNHGGDPLWSILGPMGSHWVQKMGQNRAELPCRKIRT